MRHRLFRLKIGVRIRVEDRSEEIKVPLLRKVRHSFPGTPLTSFKTRVEPPAVTVPPAPAAAVVPDVAAEAGEVAAADDAAAAGAGEAAGGAAAAPPAL